MNSAQGVSGDKKAAILIVEDHPIFRFGLSELINQEEDLFVCGDADSINKAWKEIENNNPDLVIVDISLKDRNGIELIKDIKKHYPDLPVLVLSMHDESLYAERALHAGAKGYIVKQEASESIVVAVRHVLSGKTYFSEAFMEKMMSRFAGQPENTDKSPVERLTDRELEVFQMYGNGLKTKEIADRLNLSVKTIGTYRERIKDKLNLQNTNELIKIAADWAARRSSF